MKVIKGYVKNSVHPEGCIVECYIVEKCVHFCSAYLKQVAKVGAQHGRNEDLISETILEGCPISSRKPITVSDDLLEIAHHLVLFHSVEI